MRTPSPPREFLEGRTFKSLEINDIKKEIDEAKRTTVQRRKRQHLLRVVTLSFAVLFMLGTGGLWILSLLGIVAGYWAGIFGVVFVVLGVLFSFFQWVLPQVAQSNDKTDSATSH